MENKKGNVSFVSTPIGNLQDITLRALEVLRAADCILCEDTRHSRILLDHYEIKKPLKPYHKFNETAMLAEIQAMLEEGKRICVISDAGMPCISDPGSILVRFLQEQGYEYTLLPGACAFATAFALSGFEAPVTFVGFLPGKTAEKKALIERVSSGAVLVLYSSPHDVNRDLAFLYEALGAREIAVVKELTKLHESVQKGKLPLSLENPKGEYVLVVNRVEQTNRWNELSVEEHVRFYLDSGMSKMEAMKQTAKDRGVSKSEIYQKFI